MKIDEKRSIYGTSDYAVLNDVVEVKSLFWNIFKHEFVYSWISEIGTFCSKYMPLNLSSDFNRTFS